MFKKRIERYIVSLHVCVGATIAAYYTFNLPGSIVFYISAAIAIATFFSLILERYEMDTQKHKYSLYWVDGEEGHMGEYILELTDKECFNCFGKMPNFAVKSTERHIILTKVAPIIGFVPLIDLNQFDYYFCPVPK